MPEEIDWLEKHSEASMVLFNIVYEIEGLAKAFRSTGNSSMYESLSAIATGIWKANKDMHDAVGESIKETIDRGNENSKTILNAALASIMMEMEKGKRVK